MESVRTGFMAPRHRVFVALQLAFTAAAFTFFGLRWFANWLPSPGVSVAIIAVVAAAMSVHGEMSSYHKAFWMLIIGAFLVLELLAIRHTDMEQKQALQEERQRFSDIGDHIKSAIRQGESQYEATMEKENSVLDKTQTVAELTKRNLATVTGEGSYPCIVPQSHAVTNSAVPLTIWNRGKNPLTGVEVQLMSNSEFLNGAVLNKPTEKIDTLRYEWPKALREHVLPVPEADGVAHYMVEIWTQNGFYTEVINFRRGKYALPWAYQYWLQKNVPFDQKHPKAHGMKSEISNVCSQTQWSDDLGDGKPITRR